GGQAGEAAAEPARPAGRGMDDGLGVGGREDQGQAAEGGGVMRLTLGADPGLTGAVAVLVDGRYHDVLDMPTVGRGKAGRQSVNAAALSQWLRDLVALHPGADVVAVVEEVASRPGQGVASMFRFGQSCGVLAGVLAALRIPVV